MVTQVQSTQTPTPTPSSTPPNASDVATRTLNDNRGPNGTLDIAGVRRDLDRIRVQDPALGAQVSTAVEAQLTPVQRGELARAGYTLQAPDGSTSLRFQPGAPTVADYRAMAPGSEGRAFYDRLDRIFGDGNGQTDDTARIQTGLNQMIASGGSLEQLEANRAAPANDTGPSTAMMIADLTQLGLDIVGIVEPTPFADGANAVISLGRALFEWDASHLIGAAASGASMIPYIGDTAKFAKIPQWARTVSNAVEAVVRNPALRQALEPALRRVYDAVQSVPQGVIDLMPQSAREAFGRMKTQLDEFFGAGARNADEAGTATRVADTSNVGRTVRINGREVRIGDAPVTGRAADGTPTARTANGDEVRLRQPGATNTTRTANPDGTVTYTRNGQSVRYDANGFPMFNARGDVYLPPNKLSVGSRATHDAEASRILGRSTDDQLRGAGFSNADIAALRRGEVPDGYTWHHHQDVGRMQLVRSSEHDALAGGHTGGWSLWGDARRFTYE